jgi:hypothetical protein
MAMTKIIGMVFGSCVRMSLLGSRINNCHARVDGREQRYYQHAE